MQAMRSLESAQAFCASEMTSLMIVEALPSFNKHYEAGGPDAHALLCRQMEARLNLGLFTVTYPFPVFLDNARNQVQLRTALNTNWQCHPARQRLQEQLQQAMDAARTVADAAYALKVQARPDLDADPKGRKFLIAMAWEAVSRPSLADDSTQPEQVRNVARLMCELRALCKRDPTAAGFAAAQWGALADKTPDINSPAENDVNWYKGYTYAEVMGMVFDAEQQEQLEHASTYINALLTKTEKLNTPEGLLQCKAAVDKAWARVQLLAADATQDVEVELVSLRRPKGKDPVIVREKVTEKGLAGRWSAQHVFKF